jgi:hypothetical protein
VRYSLDWDDHSFCHHIGKSSQKDALGKCFLQELFRETTDTKAQICCVLKFLILCENNGSGKTKVNKKIFR